MHKYTHHSGEKTLNVGTNHIQSIACKPDIDKDDGKPFTTLEDIVFLELTKGRNKLIVRTTASKRRNKTGMERGNSLSKLLTQYARRIDAYPNPYRNPAYY